MAGMQFVHELEIKYFEECEAEGFQIGPRPWYFEHPATALLIREYPRHGSRLVLVTVADELLAELVFNAAWMWRATRREHFQQVRVRWFAPGEGSG